MIANLRAAAALSSCLVVASGAWASSPQDAALNMPNNGQACSLPSVTASSPITQDPGVHPASAGQAVVGDLTTSEAADQNSCSSCDACSCNSCDACSSCMCCCPPLWYVSAGAVILHRDSSTAGTIVAGNPSLVPFSRGSDLNFDWAAGPDITIARRMGCNDYLEGRYFNSYESADIQFSAVVG